MENETKKTEVAQVEKTNKELFVEGFEKLQKETKHQLVAYPKFINRDDGTFSVVVAYDVTEIKQN